LRRISHTEISTGGRGWQSTEQVATFLGCMWPSLAVVCPYRCLLLNRKTHFHLREPLWAPVFLPIRLDNDAKSQWPQTPAPGRAVGSRPSSLSSALTLKVAACFWGQKMDILPGRRDIWQRLWVSKPLVCLHAMLAGRYDMCSVMLRMKGDGKVFCGRCG
jgi:hypothetical protein